VTSGARSAAQARTYGGWRRARGVGLFGAGPVGTVAVVACLVVPMLVAGMDPTVGLLSALPAALVAALVLARVGGTSVASVVQRRLRWTWGSARGYAMHRAGGVVEHPSAWQLPGVLASTELLTVRDERGGSFALVWDRRSGFLTATLRCAAASTWLVDGNDADGWVANWHAWLASLGYLPMVKWVAVTVDTSPAPAGALRHSVLPRIDAAAPTDVRRLMHDLVERSPGAAADIETRVSITFDPSSSSQRPRDLEDAVAEVTRQLPGLESALGSCGVSVLGRMGAPRLAATVQAAFDPASRGELLRAMGGGEGGRDLLEWGRCGPVGADERWDCYQHDSGLSASWAWREAPRQQVTGGVLTRLLSPGRYGRRVTLLFRPLSAGDAARVLEGQVNAAAFRDAYRRAQNRDETARDAADRERARQAAQEEAAGAGVVLMSLYVTATVANDQELADAVADVEARADQSKVQLRRLFGSQSAGFATTLPLGFCPVYAASRGLNR
jgi:hypothetical protein